MGRNKKQIFIFLILIIGIFATYFMMTKNRNEEAALKNATEAEKLLSMDLTTSYPKTPTAVITLYSRISKTIHNDDWDNDTINALIDEMYQLYSPELQAVNPLETFRKNLKTEIAEYRDTNKKVMTYQVDGNDNVVTSSENNIELAKLNVSYTLSEKNKHEKLYQNYILKKEGKQWKILGWKSVPEVEITKD